MKLERRRFLRLAVGATALPTVPRFAWAQAYPSRPVHLVVGFAAGGSADIFARILCQWLSERLDQQFVVENRPGVGTNIAAGAVMKAPPDGYTLFLASTANAINATLYQNLHFDFIHDIAPVAGTLRVPNVMEVNPSVPAKTVPEFIAYAKANPGTINMGSGGAGTTIHLAGELFKMMTGVNMLHVPYRSTPQALTELLSGRMQVMFDVVPESIEHIEAGELRALAVTTATRSEALPNVPIMSDFLPGYEASSWNGIVAPKNTPAEVVEKLNKEVNAGLADPQLKARLAGLGGTAMRGSPADFGKFIADETEKWGMVIRAANVRVE